MDTVKKVGNIFRELETPKLLANLISGALTSFITYYEKFAQYFKRRTES